MRIDGSVVVVTGASSGIGAATARLLGERGARVVLAARNAGALARLAGEIPGSLAVPTDVTDPAAVAAMVAATLDRCGRVDALVNNAGQGLHVPVERVNADDFRAILDLNVVAPLLAMQAVIPPMRAQGSGAIVNVSSGTSLMTPRGFAAYAATKGALNLLSKGAREELAPDGIVVSLVYPFVTETAFHANRRQLADRPAGAPPLPPGHTPEFVARWIAHALETGEAEVMLRPDTPEAPAA